MFKDHTEINLDLWKYFTDDAAKIKDRMWTIASWMFTLQAGLLAYIAKHLSADVANYLNVDNSGLVIMEISLFNQLNLISRKHF